MSISSLTSSIYVAPSALTQNIQSSSQVNSNTDQNGDGDGGVRRAQKGGGGQMQNALMQALQSLGFSIPQPTSSTTATTATTGTSAVSATSGTSSGAGATAIDGDADSDGSTFATSSVKKDIGQFMHALFKPSKTRTLQARHRADQHRPIQKPILLQDYPH
jgi:hypothetical protein